MLLIIIPRVPDSYLNTCFYYLFDFLRVSEETRDSSNYHVF